MVQHLQHIVSWKSKSKCFQTPLCVIIAGVAATIDTTVRHVMQLLFLIAGHFLYFIPLRWKMLMLRVRPYAF